MTSCTERQTIITLIQQANTDGARLNRACAEADICLRTYRRWYRDGAVQQDKRPAAIKPAPANKLSVEERAHIVELCNSPAYSQLPPSQIVPDLLDRGIYVASEPTFYRVLRGAGQLHHRGHSVAPQRRHDGQDVALLAQRKAVLEQARQSNPSRWGTRPVRNCDPAGPVTLNPEKEADMRQAA